MTVKKKTKLGKGLGALLGEVKPYTEPEKTQTTQTESVTQAQATARQMQSVSGYKVLGVEQLVRGEYQPRMEMDKVALETLSESIRREGVIQPLLARALPSGQFEIIAGERRWRAAQLAGLKEVPVVVRELNDEKAMAIGLIENIQRENLNAIEEAQGLVRLSDEFGLSHQEIAEAVGRSRAAVTNLMRLLSLSDAVQTLVKQGELEMGHARALLALTPEDQIQVAQDVIKKGLSVRATERLVKSSLRGNVKKPQEVIDPDLQNLQEQLSENLGAKVEIKHGNKKGQLVIHYFSLDELDGILEKLSTNR